MLYFNNYQVVKSWNFFLLKRHGRNKKSHFVLQEVSITNLLQTEINLKKLFNFDLLYNSYQYF